MKRKLISCAIVGATVCVWAQTNVTTKMVAKTYSGKAMSAETNITHTVAGHEALKRRGRKTIGDADAALALRESRMGYKGGEWSERWSKEAVVWLEEQDLLKMPNAFEFVDSKGFRHLMAKAIEPCERNPVRQKMSLTRAEMYARATLTRVWDADVERLSAESKCETGSSVETLKFESVTSVGTLRGLLCIMSKMVNDDGQLCSVVVYGIEPRCMKFDSGVPTATPVRGK